MSTNVGPLLWLLFPILCRIEAVGSRATGGIIPNNLLTRDSLLRNNNILEQHGGATSCQVTLYPL